MTIPIVMAARNHLQPLTAAGKYKPGYCHEAVLGWVLISLGYPHAWELVAKAAEAERAAHGSGQAFNGDWMCECIYPGSFPLMQASALSFANVGDILWTGNPGRANHSMVVVEKTVASVFVRGLNNGSTFVPLSVKYPSAPSIPSESEYDDFDRDAADPCMWTHATGAFGSYPDIFLYRALLEKTQPKVAENFPWEGSKVNARTAGKRWHHNIFQGWHFS